MKRTKNPKAIGVDFGGTFVKMAMVSHDGEILARSRISTKEAASQEAWLDAVEQGMEHLCESSGTTRKGLSGIGVGVPGFVDFEKGHIHKLPNVPGWEGVPLAKELTDRFKMPAFVDNDVNAMALGEFKYGAGKDYRDAVFVTLGTGVGGGIVINGELHRGAYSMAGELGHMCIRQEGLRSPQGRGTLEKYIGNQKIIERAQRALEKGRPSLINALVDGHIACVTPKIISKAAHDGDALALEIYDYVADCLATAFASVTYLLQPEVFIVGGGVSLARDVLFVPLRQHLSERLSPYFAERVDVIHAQRGNDAGMIGSAALVWSA